MKLVKYLQNLSTYLGMATILFFTSDSLAAPCKIEFESVSTEVIIDAFETEPRKKPLLDLYQKVCFISIWLEEKRISRRGKELFRLIKEDRTLSHDTKLFKKAVILEREAMRIYADDVSFSQQIELEFELSKLYKKYAEYRLYGSIDWRYFYRYRTTWVRYKPKMTPVILLEKVVNEGVSLKKAFLDAEPKEYHYQALKRALFSYLDLKERKVWKPIPEDQTIRLKEESDIIPIIRERLRITRDDMGCPDEGLVYDTCLRESVIRFQRRNGLRPDGKIGRRTIKALNRSLDKSIALIKLNLDRIKWLHQRGDKRHIIVNIPAFALYFEENGRLRLQMKVITGKRRNRTPIFSNTVQQIVLNPYWNVPKSIIQKEMIPKILKNPNAMRRDGIDIYTGWGRNARKVDAGSVDWEAYRYAKRLPFRFAQPPGRRNALGKVKFLFPNRFSVYMHDTPSKYLFNRTVRAFSHGCIRLEKPLELLSAFVSFNDTMKAEVVQKILKGNRRVYFKLDREVPVDVVYLTAWVDYDGVLQFRNDIYGYDKIQLSKMKTW